MIRILNIILLVSSVSLLTLLVFIFVESLNILKLFPFVILSFMFLISSFVIKLFIKNNELPKFIQWGIIILALLPLSVPMFGLIDPFQVEGNWPLMVAGLVFYSGLGLLSVSGIFTKQNKPPLLSRIFLILFGLMLAAWFIFILLKISDIQLYNYTFLFGLLASVFYLISMTISFSRKN
jgi:hypothetical protein